MDRGIFIQTNNSQLIAAKVAKFAAETRGCARAHGIPVALMNVDEMPQFLAFAGARFRNGAKLDRYNPGYVQSFTLSRFMPPELMGFSGRALVIDPDVLLLGDVIDLFSIELAGNSIAACRRPFGWESSVMLLDCAKLGHWKIDDILAELRDLSADYVDLILLRDEPSVLELPSSWNSHDTIGAGTRALHMTRLETQPWRTGLLLDYGQRASPILGLFPRERVRRLLGKRRPVHQSHPERRIEQTFMQLLGEAFHAGAILESEIKGSIRKGFIRSDIWKHVTAPGVQEAANG